MRQRPLPLRRDRRRRPLYRRSISRAYHAASDRAVAEYVTLTTGELHRRGHPHPRVTAVAKKKQGNRRAACPLPQRSGRGIFRVALSKYSHYVFGRGIFRKRRLPYPPGERSSERRQARTATIFLLSRLDKFTPPCAAVSKVELAVVQAMFAMRPELDRIGTYAKSGPTWRARDFRASELPGEPREPREKFRARAHPGALTRRARGQPALPRPGGPVRVGLRGLDFLDASLDADLPAPRLPIERERRMRIVA